MILPVRGVSRFKSVTSASCACGVYSTGT